jgi:hypothetical protein
MRIPALLSLVVGALLLAFGARELLGPAPKEPVEIGVSLIEAARTPPLAAARVTGGRGNLLEGAVGHDDRGAPETIFFPVRSLAAPAGAPASLVVATKEPAVVAVFVRPEAVSDPAVIRPERSFEGELVPRSSLSTAEAREIRKFENRLAPGFLVLREGARPDRTIPLAASGAGLLVILTGFVFLSKVKVPKPKPAPRRPAMAALPRPSLPPGFALPAPLAPPPPEGTEAPPSPLDSIPETRAIGAIPPAAAPSAPSPSPAPSPPLAPTPAEKRRLLDYSGIENLGVDEMLRKFRFTVEKAAIGQAGVRVFPFVGRPYELGWEEISEIQAWRCPNQSPWHEMIVVELVATASGDGRPRPPARLVPRTRVDLGEGVAGAGGSGNVGRLRSLAVAVTGNATTIRIGQGTLDWLQSGNPPPQLKTLRELARHDAKFPD